MFKGIWLKAKTLQVLKQFYFYDPAVPGIQNGPFSASVRYALKNGGNEFDAAALFMAGQCEMLCKSPELDDDGRAFVRGMLNSRFSYHSKLKCQEIRSLVPELDGLAKSVRA
jgi:hypothetical protein